MVAIELPNHVKNSNKSQRLQLDAFVKRSKFHRPINDAGVGVRVVVVVRVVVAVEGRISNVVLSHMSLKIR